MKNYTIIWITIGIVFLLSACNTTKVSKVPKGEFVTDNSYVSGNDTLSVQYNTSLNKVEVFTKDYRSQKDSINRIWDERYTDPRVKEITAANVKIVKPTIAELRKNGLRMLSETALSSVLSEESCRGRFTIYFIYSLSTDDFRDYGFTFTWYKPEVLLTAADIESVLNRTRNLQFQYEGDTMAIDKICLMFTIPIRGEQTE